MNFPYVEFLGLTEDRVFRPMIPMVFKANGEEFKTYSLVDSGADYTILPIEAAGKLKLNLSDQPRYSLLGAGGNTFTIYKSPIEVEFVIEKKGFRSILGKSIVYFAESGSTVLLGQNGFLKYFKVVLNGKNKEVEISV
jgi:predicted aspartyl protease